MHHPADPSASVDSSDLASPLVDADQAYAGPTSMPAPAGLFAPVAASPVEPPQPTSNDPESLGQGLEGFGRRSSDMYLESMIATASPARLRLMLIERGVEVARHLATHWRETPGQRGTNEHSLKLLELLSELLSGVTDEKLEVCRTVADMYVFLCQHLIDAEEHGDPSMIDEIRLVLETEAETWRMVCANEGGASPSRARASEVLSDGLNLQG